MSTSTASLPLSTLTATPIPSTGSSWTWTFTQGLILGQASFLLLGLLFVRYVVFSPSEEVDSEGWKTRRAERAKRALLSTTAVPPPPASQLLAKTGYDMASHPAESADWLNVLLASLLQGYRNDLLSAGGEEGARQRIEKWLNPEGGRLSWLDPIEVTSLSLGKAYPLLSNARIRPADGQGRIRAEVDVDYSDSISMSLSTSVLINFPRPRFAVLPVALGVELVSIGGTLSVQLHQPVDERQHLHACLLPDFNLNLKTTSLLGSRAKLQDIPKLEQLIVSRLRSAIQDRLVHPAHISLALPRILSPSVSPTPILNDIGESAVNAMSEAMLNGVGRMVEDLIGPGDVLPGPSMSVSQADDEEFGLTEDEEDEIRVPVGVSGMEPTSPARTISSRKIMMPAGFPSTPGAIGNIPQTPLSLSHQQMQGQGQGQGSVFRRSQSQVPYAPSAATTSYRPGGGGMGGSVASVTPSESQSQFRFRGQFSSTPSTPGGRGLGMDPRSGVYEESSRKLGALNSRAG